MASPPPVPVESLLAQRAWMRSLARSLVRDDSAADDLVQEAWVDVLRSPPVHGGGLRGWLATILRRRARDAWRSRSRRDAREAAAARPEALRSPAEVVAEADLHRRVVEAVMELEEPYRGTLLQRFYEDRSPGEIAAAQGIPAATVHTRIRRGLERMRARLDAGQRGGRRAWMAALLPLAGIREGAGAAGAAGGAAAAATTGGVIVGTKAVVVAAVVGAAVGTVVTGFAAGTLGGGDRGPVGDPGASPEVAALRGRLDALERRAPAEAGMNPSAAGSMSEVRVEALERRLSLLESMSPRPGPDGVTRRPATGEEEKQAEQAREAMEKAERVFAITRKAEEAKKESVEDLRLRACDTTLPVEERTKALTGLRFAKDGVDDAVIDAMTTLFRSGIEPGFRAVILRDLHKNPDERLRRLFLDALQSDPEPMVRVRAASDIDTWREDPEVRVALERARDGDADETVRRKAGAMLDTKR